jgi:hypothetical protein
MHSVHPAVPRGSSHGVWLRRTLLAAGLVALAVGVSGCPSEPSASGGKVEGSPAEVLAKQDKWQEGEACVANNAPDCPSVHRGVCRSARAPGCTHEACTEAKNQARANLRAAVPQECYKYIQSTAPCSNGPGC